MLFSNVSGLLTDSVGNNHINNEDDILKTRKNISKLVPEYDEDNDIPLITGRLDKAIKSFQKDNGLKIDGKINPAGETERAMFEKLENKPSETIFGDLYDDQEIGFGTGNSYFVAKEPRKPQKIRTKPNKIKSGINDISTLMKLAKVDDKYSKILDTVSGGMDSDVI